MNKAVRLFLLLLLGQALTLSKANAVEWKTEPLPIGKAGELSVPARIVPVLVEAPPRRVDLLPGRPEAGAHSVSFPLTGLPVALYDFPVLKFSAGDQEPGLFGIELTLGARDGEAGNTLVRVGDPALFPDMVNERIDFRSVEFAARDLGYRIKRALGIAGDKKWRYTAIGAKVNGIASGIVNASFEPGSDLVLQRAFASPDLAKTPWLRYEYELPRGLPWIVQINAKVDRGGLSPKLTTLFSEPVRGGGKRNLLANLYDLLQKADPGARNGRLEELIIHVTLDRTAESAVLNADISLGTLALYDSQISRTGSKVPAILVSAGGASTMINLEEQLGSTGNKLTVLSGRLVGAQEPSDVSEDFPSISLLAPFPEKIPELFAGAQFFLRELNAAELSAVLDQRLFIEKHVLWESGPSDLVLLKPAGYDSKQAGLALPLVSYPLNVKIDGNAYVEADYSFEGGGPLPLYMTLSGTDQHGQAVVIDRVLLKKTPLKVKDIHIRKITLSFRQEQGAPPPRTACVIKSIQISSFKKSAVYHPQPASAYVALDGGIVPTGDFVWRAAPGRVEFNRRAGEGFQTVQTFPVEAKIVGDAVVRSNLTPVSGGNYFLRVRGSEGGNYFEKMLPLSMREDVRLSNLVLHGLDLVIKGDGTRNPGTAIVNQLDVQYLGKAGREEAEPTQPRASGSSEIVYLAPHLAVTDPLAAMAHPALATGTVQPDLTMMNRLDATLSYAQILSGGKTVVLPKTFLIQGAHELNHVSGKGVSVVIDQSFLKSNRDQLMPVKGAMKAAPSKLAKIGLLLVLAGGLVWLLGVKFVPRWGPLVGRALARELPFLGVQFALLGSAFYLMFFRAAKDAFSWGGLLLVLAYGVAMRYRIRPYLARKWAFFSERHSAPYFLLFLALLLSCAVMLMFKLEAAAEHAAVIGYYLLVTGVAVEFICFAKEAKGGLTALEPNEKPPSRE